MSSTAGRKSAPESIPAPALALPGVSITRTQRRRFFWAAWWSNAPQLSPFRKPDASDGGALTEAAAHARAEAVAGRTLTRIDDYWAHACNRMLRGEPPPPRRPRANREVSADTPTEAVSAWAVLGLSAGSTLREVKQAYRSKALASHPDRGGDAATFRELTAAYEKLVVRLAKRRPRQP